MGSTESKPKVRKRPGQTSPRTEAALEQRLRKRLGADTVNIGKSVDGAKMSEVLKAFIEPFMGFVDTKEDFEKLVAIGAAAWNASLVSGKDRAELINAVVNTVPPEARTDARHSIRDLMKRKKRYFGEFKRMIIDFKVKGTRKGFHLQVVSTADGIEE